MTNEMDLSAYLAEGGRLTSPVNVPPRYRAELLKLMATFVDSSLAGAAGFADVINAGPGIKQRISAARIVLEKTANAERVLRVMGEFGVDEARYATHHPWTARLERSADVGASRTDHDMRLAVFCYPLQGWHDAVVMNLLMGSAVVIQLDELVRVSYQPLAEAFRTIRPIETRHAELAQEGMPGVIDSVGRDDVQTIIDYWWPRVAASFGSENSAKFATLRSMGLRHVPNQELRETWVKAAKARLAELDLKKH